MNNKRGKKVLIIILVILLLVVGVAAAILFHFRSMTNYQKDEDVKLDVSALQEGSLVNTSTPASGENDDQKGTDSSAFGENKDQEKETEVSSDQETDVPVHDREETSASEMIPAGASGKTEEDSSETASGLSADLPAEEVTETVTETITETITEPVTETVAEEAAEDSQEEMTGESVEEAVTETEDLTAFFESYDISGVNPVSEEQLKGTYTVLVIGGSSPQEEEETGKRQDADAVIVMTINHNMGRVVFTSLKTNTFVLLPGLGGTTLAKTYAAGGGPLLAQAIEDNFGVHIDNYATISLKDVARIMQMPAFEEVDISQSGLQVVEDLVFSLGKLNAAEVMGYITELMPYVTHNVQPDEFIGLILQIPRILPYYSVKDKLPYEGLYEEANGYYLCDAAETARIFQEMTYGTGEEAATESVAEAAAETATESATETVAETATESATGTAAEAAADTATETSAE